MGRLSGPALACALALACTTACGRPDPSPARAATPVLPTPNAPTVPDEADEMADAFEAEVRQIADQATFLANAPCDRLVSATDQDPTLVPMLRGFAATLKGLANREEALARSSSERVLREMDQALAALDQSLRACKIDPRPSEARRRDSGVVARHASRSPGQAGRISSSTARV